MAEELRLDVKGTPEEVLERLAAALPSVGSVWFPTRREIAGWQQSEAPLYLRRIGVRAVEVGPRLNSLPAARFCPVLRGTLSPGTEGRTAFAWRPAFPRLTLALLALWGVVLTAWAVDIASGLGSGERHPIWLLWWGLLATATTAGGVGGWSYGLRMLKAALPWLRERVDAERVVDEQW